MRRPPRRAAARGLFAAAALTCASLEAGPPAATSLFPAGGGRGQTVEVTASGSFDAWPVQAWVHEPGLAIEPAAEKGKFVVTIATDAPPGVRWVRLFDGQGAAAPLPFEVGTAAGVAEAEPNDGPGGFQAVGPLPVVVDGRFGKAGDVDGFAVDLAAGQTLVASLKGHRLGSPMDAVLQVVSPAGFVLGQSDDEVGLDPRLVFGASEAGRYVVRGFAFPSEPNSTIGFAGGEKFVYRLILTTGPFLDHTLPLAVPAADAAAELEAQGWNLDDDAKRLRAGPAAAAGRVRAWHPSAAGAVELPVLPLPVLVESAIATGDGSASLAVPTAVSGRIATARERDVYRFVGKQGQVWRLRVTARALASPLDPVLRVLDADGKVLAERDDTGEATRDAELTFSVPADGEYRVSVHDLSGDGGPRYVYLLEVAEPTPDFRLTLAEDRVTVAPGKPATVAVTVTREHGFDRPVEISVLGLPDAVTAAPVRDETAPKPEEASAKKGRRGGDAAVSTASLVLTAGDGSAPFSGPVRTIGRAGGEGAAIEHAAVAPLPAPGAEIDRVWLTVVAESK